MSGRGDRGGRGRGRGDGGGRGRGDRGRGASGVGFGAPRGGQRGGRGGGGPAPPEAFHYPDGIVPSTDANVTKVEDVTLKSTAAGKQKPSTDISELPDISSINLDELVPRRPGYGTRGTPITLWANYFQLMPKTDLKLYRYAIGIQPDATGRKRTRLVEQLITEGQVSALKKGLVSDFKSTLISDRELLDEYLRESIVYKFEGEDEPNQGATTYRFRLQSTGSFTVAELVDYLSSTNISAAFSAKTEVDQALNIVLGFHPKASPSNFSVGANKHYAIAGPSAQSFDLGAGLTAWRGYFTSVRTAAARLLLNVQVKHVAAYENMPLDGLMLKYASVNGKNVFKLESFLKKVRVETTHLAVKKNKSGQKIPRIKTINGLATTSDGQGLEHRPRVNKHGASAKGVEFWLEGEAGGSKEKPSTPAKKGGKQKGAKAPPAKQPAGPSTGGRYISVFDFFKMTYNRTVREDVPVINAGDKKNPMYLPADVCVVLPGQAANTKLSPSQTQQMINFAVRKPFDNARSIVQDGRTTLGLTPLSPTLTQFGIQAGNKLITVPGRILTGPNVKYRQNVNASTRFGSWNMENIKFVNAGVLRSWTTLWISKQGERDAWRNDNEMRDTLMAFHRALRANGVSAEEPIWPGPHINVDDENYDSVINDIFKRVAANPKKPELLLVLLPSKNIQVYNRVKYYGDIVYGLHTICAVGNKFSKMKMFRGEQGYDLQYFANVALKFNLKRGGINQALEPAKLGIISQGKTMVVGIDVTHPSPGSASNAPSVAGMVASIDRGLGQWPAILRIQEKARQEMVSDLGEMLISRLRLWQKHNNNALPENILVYRDGVSEGQYKLVLNKELPLLEKACRKVYPASKAKSPKTTVIVVGKRHHTRFYPTSTAPNVIDERSSNPKNGTVVDRGVTEPRNWDFFLQAHTAIQGTARPAHYFIVHDEIFAHQKPAPPLQNAADILEDLTHNMCYMFGRATKAVSICPPAYYADLVCERARCYLSGFYDVSVGPTPSASTASGSEGTAAGQARMVQVHERLKDTMFYI